jgi:hypothetical protein
MYQPLQSNKIKTYQNKIYQSCNNLTLIREIYDDYKDENDYNDHTDENISDNDNYYSQIDNDCHTRNENNFSEKNQKNSNNNDVIIQNNHTKNVIFKNSFDVNDNECEYNNENNIYKDNGKISKSVSDESFLFYDDHRIGVCICMCI